MSSISTDHCDFSSFPSTKSSSPQRWNYHVFLSFRGDDTRNNFTSHLHAALKRERLRIFIDEDDLPGGEEISPHLRKAIKESRICVIVFSKDYSSSSWCLDELLEILECKKHNGSIVLPVFYHVEPSDVRYQKGSFADSFAKHEQRFVLENGKDKIKMWRSALSEAADLSGYSDKNRKEATLIEEIVAKVADVLREVESTNLNISDKLVGLDPRVDEIVAKLSLESKEVDMLGIYGLGGIGKTTTAQAVFNQISHKFDGSYFAKNVKDTVTKDGLVSLLQRLISKITKNEVTFGDADEGYALMKQRFPCIKALIVLDDVENWKQIESVAGKKRWLGEGSRILITTRDLHLLNQARVYNRYEVQELNENKSMELFCLHAFHKPSSLEEFESLSKEAVRYCGGLPLALEVIGSYMVDKSTMEWKSAIQKLYQVPKKEILEILKVSFDALNDDEIKAVFLDIACLFAGEKKGSVINFWNACGFYAEDAIGNLTRKSLLKVDSCDRLMMHDHVRDMGREIIRNESPNWSERRSRLWHHTDVVDVIKNNKGTEAIESIKLEKLSNSERIKFKTRNFEKMTTLRFLQIDNVDLSGSFNHLFQELKGLRWHGNTMTNLPYDFKPEKLVILDMHHGQFTTLWRDVKHLQNLTILDLSNCKCLKETPNFSGVISLEKLYLSDCTSLLEIHPSIGVLVHLQILNLCECEVLGSIPDSICNLKDLKYLSLHRCSKFKNLPKQIGRLTCLKFLDVAYTLINDIPESIILLSKLEFFNLRSTHISHLPHSICDLESLEELSLEYCLYLRGLPEQLGRMKRLKIAVTGINTYDLLEGSNLLDRVKHEEHQTLAYCKTRNPVTKFIVII